MTISLPTHAHNAIDEYLAAHRELETANALTKGLPIPLENPEHLVLVRKAAERYAPAYLALAALVGK